MHAKLESMPRTCAIVRWYVDDFFICVMEERDVHKWIYFVKQQAPELSFKTKFCTTGFLQFLDLNVFTE